MATIIQKYNKDKVEIYITTTFHNYAALGYSQSSVQKNSKNIKTVKHLAKTFSTKNTEEINSYINHLYEVIERGEIDSELLQKTG